MSFAADGPKLVARLCRLLMAQSPPRSWARQAPMFRCRCARRFILKCEMNFQLDFAKNCWIERRNRWAFSESKNNNLLSMKLNKPSAGRPKHVAVYEQGQKAQANFLAGMKAILRPSSPSGALSK